jgi:hypothetical protein
MLNHMVALRRQPPAKQENVGNHIARARQMRQVRC